MAQIVWTQPALSDLNDIAEYVAIENTLAAKQLVQSIFNAIERLEAFPESGRTPPELPTLPYREVIVSPCRVFYKYDGNSIYILFVMRQEQDLKRFMLSKK
ncbi:type II toxin-antitoxin system RelE/ParE family toxin [Vibrio sp. SCSIO 43136]|uniref:type II toxin-antitoxin system RelE/ParE family toxin n=1 Tax=Vibrio sp. SCSIO 43136 TaxID=2819101 RepID=UPI002074E2DC|nr:type II toxin-antitoxin system RelE/ParE family toxin [Vibrio sp. SCSIO 43136]USD66312.1 type II toxin-antitoxin system RelE/ParE family toxin [Vibrio sp. SCSIO 43136]